MENQSLAFSVIIPAYNNGEYVREALESVLCQTFPPFEIIVVDSSDNETTEIIQEYKKHIKYVFQKKQGIGTARNLGVRLAQGNFFAHLDADDIWKKDKLMMQREAFSADPSLDIIGTQMESFLSPELDQATRKKLYCPPEPVPGYSASAMAVKSDAFFRVGMYETFWKVGQDLNWFIRAREAGLKEKMILTPLVLRRLHKTNTDQLNRLYKHERVRILKESLDRRRRKTQG